MKKNKLIILVMFILIIILYVKNQFSSLLLLHSSYGMPALIQQNAIDNLFVGSSMFRQGIDIQTLESCSPDSSYYILAYNGNQPATEHFQLNHLVEHDVKIKTLYIDMYVYSAFTEPKISDEKLFLELNLREKWELYNIISHPTFTDTISSFFELFIQSNNELLSLWPLNYFLLNKQFHNGGSMLTPVPASTEKLNSYSIPEITPHMNPEQQIYLVKLISLAKDNHIEIIFIETPKYESVANSASYLNAMKSYITFLDQQNVPYLISQNTLNRITPPSISPFSYPFDHDNAEYFSDTLHLSYEGRIAFTSRLTGFKTTTCNTKQQSLDKKSK